MNTHIQIEQDNFWQTTAKNQYRIMKILHWGMLGGIVAVGASVVKLWLRQDEFIETETAGEVSLLHILTAMHIAVAVICFPLGRWVFKKLVSARGMIWQEKNRFFTGISEDARPAQGLFIAMAVRLFIFLVPAMNGLVVCMIGIFSGELAEKPVYWGNLTSSIIFVFLVLATFPTQTRLDSLIPKEI